ncbi:hypothetical protein DLM45_15965 [Hyphomicrobium methylovorum]|uniref:(5-formylfuran-3-yl)methyl phosphate synthase n=1 Tax=Hyphomicrobium methylovorum TaxID=84 RepID=UPI0015E7C6ED|nr:(5-formylfuran-3-yl)methyl phosphate synthase [Hyphomicrobium methylovorum]MBA2127707.1 hypothetical protein [Hyphomicrobium methylovorum]
MIAGLKREGPAFLASVKSAEEALAALDAGADLIDGKDPVAGALGALDLATVRGIVDAIASRRPVSATVGDLPAEPEAMASAVTEMASTGVDLIKIGFFGDRDPQAAIQRLGRDGHWRGRMVAVLMADRAPDFAILPLLAANGFAGVMLDTAGKSSGRLTSVLSRDRLAEFVRTGRAAGLTTGLAGSLAIEDIASLMPLSADILGFRGALCRDGRTGTLDPQRVAAVHAALTREFKAPQERSVA